MAKYYTSTGKLSYCPFCGKKASWRFTRELGFVNKASFKCYHCDGRISINENEIKNHMAFDMYNRYDVESTGKYNFGLLSGNSTYDVVTLIEKSNFAHINGEQIFSNESTKEKTSPSANVVNRQYNANKIDNESNEKSKKYATKNNSKSKLKVITNTIVIVGVVILCLLIYFNFIK